jgi:hypothetical protein
MKESSKRMGAKLNEKMREATGGGGPSEED